MQTLVPSMERRAHQRFNIAGDSSVGAREMPVLARGVLVSQCVFTGSTVTWLWRIRGSASCRVRWQMIVELTRRVLVDDWSKAVISSQKKPPPPRPRHQKGGGWRSCLSILARPVVKYVSDTLSSTEPNPSCFLRRTVKILLSLPNKSMRVSKLF